MNIEEFKIELNKNIPKLLDENIYISILNRNNNLARFDIINKIALCTLHEQVYDIKTAEEWFDLGRKIIDKSKVIHIMIPNYISLYRDTVTGEEVDLREFTQDEFNKAIELNVIQRESSIDGLYIQSVFDIRNTSNIDKGTKYNMVKPNVSLSTLFNIVKEITGMTVEQSDETYYSKGENHLYLAKDKYNVMISNLADILSDYLVESGKYDLKGLDRRLIKDSVSYSIKTLFKVNDKDRIVETIRYSKITDYMELLNILVIVDNIVFEIMNYVEFSDNSTIRDASADILKLKKAEVLLDIMQANSIQLKIKGN